MTKRLGWWLLAALLIVAAGIAVLRGWWSPPAPDGAAPRAAREESQRGKARLEGATPHLRGKPGQAEPEAEPAREPSADVTPPAAIADGWWILSGHLAPTWALPAHVRISRMTFLWDETLGERLLSLSIPAPDVDVVVGRDGHFHVPDLPPGTWSVEVEGRDGTCKTYWVEVWQDESAVELGEESVWPVVGPGVSIPWNGNGPLFGTPRPPGIPLRLHVSVPPPRERTTGSLRLESPNGDAEDWDLELDEQGVLLLLVGAVTSGGHAPIDDLDGDDTVLTIHDAPPGRHTLTLALEGYAAESRTVDLTGPTHLAFSLRREPGRWVRVVTAAKTWWLECRREGAFGTADTEWGDVLWADERVRFRWQSHPSEAYVAEGDYLFRLRSVDQATSTWGPVAVLDGEERLVLRPPLTRGATLAGPVTAPDLTLLDGVPLYLLRQSGTDGWRRVEEKRARVDRDRYAFKGLDPGRYRVAPTEAGLPVLAEVEVGQEDVTCGIDFGPDQESPGGGR